jgi:hypothetical protein
MKYIITTNYHSGEGKTNYSICEINEGETVEDIIDSFVGTMEKVHDDLIFASKEEAMQYIDKARYND